MGSPVLRERFCLRLSPALSVSSDEDSILRQTPATNDPEAVPFSKRHSRPAQTLSAVQSSPKRRFRSVRETVSSLQRRQLQKSHYDNC